ncbi:hypothetical protein FGO68_gene12243 [Halteria grandinella]|uniref:Uncharacterized protein n=1 Tax=Halteria grandinella TaxID=5974 RepID=A0A8J8T702_HALGN|nr:hypothetical protein FGO68_gene12243 [Halteria grandinella]
MYRSKDQIIIKMLMDSAFEKLVHSKDQHLKQLLHPREEAHKHLDKQKNAQQNFYDDSSDSNQAKENAYKEEFLKQLKLVDPHTQQLQQHLQQQNKAYSGHSFTRQSISITDQNALHYALFQEKSPIEAYYETFNLRPPSKDMQKATLGVDQLINEDDKQRIRNVQGQIRQYLEEITEEGNPTDGLLTSKMQKSLAQTLSEEMTAFSRRLIERKEKEKIQDLANTSNLALPGGDTSKSRVNTNVTHQSNLSTENARGRISSFNHGGGGSPDNSPFFAETDPQWLAKKDELMAKFERIRLSRTSGPTSDFSLLATTPSSITIEDIISLPLKKSLAPPKETIHSKKNQLQISLNINTPAQDQDGLLRQRHLNKFVRSVIGEDRHQMMMRDIEKWVQERDFKGDALVEVASADVFRDIGPLCGELECASEIERTKEGKRIQRLYLKSYLEQKKNNRKSNRLQQELLSSCLNEEQYLLSLSNIVPLSKFIETPRFEETEPISPEKLRYLDPHSDMLSHVSHAHSDTSFLSDLPNPHSFHLNDSSYYQRANPNPQPLEGLTTTTANNMTTTTEGDLNNMILDFKDTLKPTAAQQQKIKVDSQNNVLAGLTESQLKLELITKFKGMGGALVAQENPVKEVNNASLKQLQQITQPLQHSPSILLPEYEKEIVKRLKVIEDFKQAKRQLEKNAEAITAAQKSENPKIRKLVGQSTAAQTQQLKNIERMRVELNKRMEQNMGEIMKVLDDMERDGSGSKETLFTMEDEDEGGKVISTETILRASAIATEDVDETLKARFLARLVKEYRKNRERAKQEQLREQMEQEIQANIFNRFPSLNTGPSLSPEKHKKNTSRGGDSKIKQNIFEGSFSMSKGYGVTRKIR